MLMGLEVGLSGCDAGPRVYPVQGQILVGDRPVSGALVTFHPVSGGAEAQGGTDFDGKFTLIWSNRPGVPAGQYRVTISRDDGTATGMGVPGKNMDEWRIPAKYATIRTSGLTAPVPSSPDAYRFVLDAK